MEFRILGPIEVWSERRQIALGGLKQRVLLAVLLLHRNEVVSIDRLIEELWNGDPPTTAVKVVQVYVSQLRKALGGRRARGEAEHVLVTRSPGYLLRVEPDELDAERFERVVEDGRRALGAGNPQLATRTLLEALSLWRGPALADFTHDSFAQNEIARLEEARVSALEERIEADLALGRHAELVGELESLVAVHPLRERLRGQLMLALYRSGRQAEALAAYQAARRQLDEELGLEPNESLQRLERAILVHDPALDPPAGATTSAVDGNGRHLGLPQGTVTLLFTDVEGSTQLQRLLGDAYQELVAGHRALLEEAFTAHDGVVVDRQTESFFVAFRRARDAVRAAVAALQTLADHAWPSGVEVKVRMGMHSGDPEVDGDRYVGLTVSRAARICDSAHGGQVLMSSSTQSLLSDDEQAALRDLGLHRLKDFERPERLYQLNIDGLQTDFPPLKAEKVAEPHPLRRRAIVLSALAGVIAAAVAIPIFALGQGGGGTSIEAAAGNSVGFVDARSGRLVDDVGVGATPTHVAVGEGAYWVANADDRTVSRIDPVRKAVVDTIRVGASPSGITTGNGAVWVVNSLDGTVSRIDPATNTVVQLIDVGNFPVGIAYAEGFVWVANAGDDTITRIDADSGKPTKSLAVAATELAVGGGALWASQRTASRVVRIDPRTGKVVQPIPVGNGPTGIVFGDGAVWAANSLDGTVSRLDPETNSVAAVIPTGNGPTSVAVDQRGVWVSNQFDGTLVQIDPRTNQLVRRVHVGSQPQGLVIAGGVVLVGVRQSGAGHRGGTLTIRAVGSPDSIDTAVSYYTPFTWPFLQMTGDGLVAFNQVAGVGGTQLVPDLAVSLPAAVDGGRTYVFRLRAGIRYSTGRPVRASDIRATFERDLEIGLPVTYYDGILGASRCRPQKRCDLSRGIVTDDAAGTVTFHLARPDPEFLYQLAIPFAYVVPAGTSPHDIGTHPLPATGPYVIASYRPKRLLRLVRNTYFHEWSNAAQPDGYPDEIVVRLGGTIDGAIRDVISGKSDLASTFGVETPSQGLLAQVKTRYASQVHANPAQVVSSLFLNTRLAPFDRLDVRRAVSYAVDRAAAVQAVGSDFAEPTCQILPPHYPGYRPYCPYAAGSTTRGTWTAPDLAKARALVAHSGTRGMKITVWDYAPTKGTKGLGSLIVKPLRSLGYRVSLRTLGDSYFRTAADPRTKAQIGYWAWTSDYPVASTWFVPAITCAAFRPNVKPNWNAAEFCDRQIDREITRALATQSTDPNAARKLWERIDREVVDRAPLVPLIAWNVIDVLSKRVGNYQYSGRGLGMLIDQLWVR